MKALRTIMAAALSLAGLLSAAQSPGDAVTLNLMNGGLVKGVLLQNEKGKVAVQTPDGTVLTYNSVEVRKISLGDVKVPETNKYATPEGRYVPYGEAMNGFYFAAESNTAVSLRPSKWNFGFEEVDVIGGYRFSYFFRLGLGVGARCYWKNDKVRYHERTWTMPVMVDMRGEFMARGFRTVTPYWNLQTGANLGDGFMIRPTIGMRIGERRSALLLGISYTGQSLKGYDWEKVPTGQAKVKKDMFVSFISLKIGYEF